MSQSVHSLTTGKEGFPLLEAVDTGEREGMLLIVAFFGFLGIETISIEKKRHLK
jgi:hypothetical protein